MAYETIIVEVENHIALIKLNRPDALNALNAELLTILIPITTYPNPVRRARPI